MSAPARMSGLETWLALLQAHQLVVEALERDLQREAALPLAWFDVLIQLASSPERKLRMQDLARSVLLSKSGLTRLVDRLADAGLVERASCVADRRVTYTVLTMAGEDALRRAVPVHADALRRHFVEHLQRADLATLGALLAKILDAHGGARVPCPTAGVLACGGQDGPRKAGR